MGSKLSDCNSCKAINIINSINSEKKSPLIRLLVLGLDNAGKTTIIKHLMKGNVEDVVSSVGFSNVDLGIYKRFQIELYDLGGNASIRKIWSIYYPLVHGIIYVIDSSDRNRLNETKSALNETMKNAYISRKPILVLLNKEDIEDSLDEVEICSIIDLERMVNEAKCPTKIETCSARYSIPKNQSTDVIFKSYYWLIDYIQRNWIELNERVHHETNEQLHKEQQLMRERFKKFREKATSNGVIQEYGIKHITNKAEVANMQQSLVKIDNSEDDGKENKLTESIDHYIVNNAINIKSDNHKNGFIMNGFINHIEIEKDDTEKPNEKLLSTHNYQQNTHIPHSHSEIHSQITVVEIHQAVDKSVKLPSVSMNESPQPPSPSPLPGTKLSTNDTNIYSNLTVLESISNQFSPQHKPSSSKSFSATDRSIENSIDLKRNQSSTSTSSKRSNTPFRNKIVPMKSLELYSQSNQ